jgi:hypothetical protein
MFGCSENARSLARSSTCCYEMLPFVNDNSGDQMARYSAGASVLFS